MNKTNSRAYGLFHVGWIPVGEAPARHALDQAVAEVEPLPGCEGVLDHLPDEGLCCKDGSCSNAVRQKAR